VVGVGFEPTNARSGRIYSPHPLATWIPYQLKKFRIYHFKLGLQDDSKKVMDLATCIDLRIESE
jgi:hypothetical protein